MPNFHSNDVSIAASALDMHKVLNAMATNLKAAEMTTGFAEDIQGLDVESLYDALHPYLGSYYMFAFASKPTGVGDDTPGESIDLGNGISFTTTYAARGRAVSDSAEVVLERCGDNYALSMRYDTAWEPNTENLVGFLMSLPEGSYGFCLMDADEYDGYEQINRQASTLAGGEGFKEGPNDVSEAIDITNLKAEYERVGGSAPVDLAQLSYACAVSKWTHWGWDEEQEDYADGPQGGFDYLEEVEVNQRTPLFKAVIEAMEWGLNSSRSIEGTAYLNRNAHIEDVKVGDTVVVASDWQNEWFDPVCLEVFDLSGRTLGNLSSGWNQGAGSLEAIAYLLPHIEAKVESVTPLSARRGNAKYALMDIKLELEDVNLGDVIDEVRALRGVPKERRVLLSKGPLAAGGLKGCVDASQAIASVDDAFAVSADEVKAIAMGADEVEETNAGDPDGQHGCLPYDPVPAATKWHMEKHQVANSDMFSIEVPDEFEVIEGFDGRVYAAPFASVCFTNEDGERDADVTESDLFEYSAWPSLIDDETIEDYRKLAIPETMVEVCRKGRYEMEEANLAVTTVDDWIVRGENCDVVVFRAKMMGFFSDFGLDSEPGQFITICPVAIGCSDFLKCTVAWAHMNENDYTGEDFATQMRVMAQTVKLHDPLRFELLDRLEALTVGALDADEFCSLSNDLGNAVMGTRNMGINNDGWRLKRRDKDGFSQNIHRVMAEAANKYNVVAARYYQKLVDALENQKAQGASSQDLKKMTQSIEHWRDMVISDVVASDDPNWDRKLNRLKIISIPAICEQIDERLHALDPDWTPKRPVPGSAFAKTLEDAEKKAEEERRKAEEKHLQELQEALRRIEVEENTKVLQAERVHMAKRDALAKMERELAEFDAASDPQVAHNEKLIIALHKENASLGLFKGKQKKANEQKVAELKEKNEQLEFARKLKRLELSKRVSSAMIDERQASFDLETKKREKNARVKAAEGEISLAKLRARQAAGEVLGPSESNKLLAEIAYALMPEGEAVTPRWLQEKIPELDTPQKVMLAMSILVNSNRVSKLKAGRVMTYTKL